MATSIPSSIGNYVWIDRNQDGIQNETTSDGLNGVTVELWSGGQFVKSIVTANDSNGNPGYYLFTDLSQGSYQIKFILPSGYVFTTKDQGTSNVLDSDVDSSGSTAIFDLGNGIRNLTWDAGLVIVQTASLGDYVWVDGNNNGLQDDGPASGLNGVTVELYNGAGDKVGETLTANDGSGQAGYYHFSGLIPGDYSVKFIKPDGYTFAKQDQGADGNDSDANASGMTVTTSLVSGENDLSWDAGLVELASLGDRVWVDTNANGQQDDGATGVSGLTVTLIGGGVDGVINGIGDTTETTITGTDGFYQFTGLAPGQEYQVQFANPDGTVFTGANIGNDASDSDADVTTGKSQIITLGAGENNTTVDAGVYTTASLGDYVWVDGNNNGLQDDGPASGLNGVTVELYNGAGVKVGETLTTTDGNGNAGYYLFTGLIPGDYSVKFIKPDGYTFAKQDQGADGIDSDANASGLTVTTSLVSGENDLSWDAGVVKFASLGDYVWYDKNADGIQDTTEAGIAGVTVTLTSGGTDGLLSTLADNTVTSTVTDSDGSYLFSDLTVGTEYQVAFATPSGFNGVSPRQQGTNVELDSDGVISDVVTLASGEFNQTIDAGFFKVGIDIEKLVHGQSTVENSGGGEGLTPGFWKTHSSYGPAPLTGWPETGYSPNDSFEVIFGVNITGSNPTLYEALGMNGGGESALLRHASAALLNASNGYVDYAYTPAQVISMTQAAFANGTFEATKNLFATQNELGADLTDLAGSSSVVNGVDMDADLPGSGPTIGVGDKAVFTYIVTNTGDTEIANVVVTDDRLTNVTYVSGDTDNDGLLDLNETWVYTATETVSGSGEIANIGTVKGTSVVGGTAVTDNDAAHYTVGSFAVLGDKVWEDTNGNGLQDSGENGIGGVTVKLNDSLGNVIKTTTTDANGNYLFDVAAGTYSVTFETPNGYVVTAKDKGGNDTIDSDIDGSTKTTANVTVTDGEVNLSLDAGVYRTASLGDRVWVDTNGNGQQDDGATGVSGLTVTLIGGGADGIINGIGDTTATTITGTNGFYQFTGLTPGQEYQVQFAKPNGTVFTGANIGNDASDSDADVTTGRSQIVKLSSGENNTTIDAGLINSAKASIGNRVWKDCDGDGIQDSTESGVAGVTVRLLGSDGITVLKTTTTNSNGDYLFDNLNVGNYAVQVVTPNGYKVTGKDQGSNDLIDSDIDQVTGRTVVTNLVAGENDLSWDAGLIVPANCVQFNFNGNSATDGTDGNIRTFTANGISVNASAFSRTDAGVWSDAYLGSYGGGLGVTDKSEGTGSGNSHTVDNLGNDNYVLFEFNQSVVVDRAFLGYVVNDSDIQIWIGTTNTPFTNHISLTDAVLQGMGFTEINTTTLSTTRWADLNAGGFVGNTLIIAADTTDTSPEDNFKIQHLSVCGPTCADPKAQIGDFVWEDRNFNGIQENGELAIGNVTVRLLNSSGTVLQTTTTDNNGKYGFNVDAGTYRVQVVRPNGYNVTKQDQGSNDGNDSDINSSGNTGLITVAAGQQNLTIDAGLYRKVSVGDKVWDDMNHNNVQDANEPGIGNIRVSLMDATGTNVLQTTTTNSSGNYLFANLDPGTYVLQFDKGNVMHYNYGAWNNMSTWKWAVKDAGSNDSIDSDVTGNGTSTTNVTKTSAFTLVSGQNDMTRDAGITPIVIDLNGDGVQTISRAASEGTFDLFGNGTAIDSGWLSKEDGFLAFDADGNGKIESISELFGGLGKGDGFAKLATYDTNNDGLVNSNDADFADLKIWQDANGNKETDAGELKSLEEVGVLSLKVSFAELPFIDGQGNLHLERSIATLEDGTAADMTDVYFNVSADDVAAAGFHVTNLASLASGADTVWE